MLYVIPYWWFTKEGFPAVFPPQQFSVKGTPIFRPPDEASAEPSRSRPRKWKVISPKNAWLRDPAARNHLSKTRERSMTVTEDAAGSGSEFGSHFSTEPGEREGQREEKPISASLSETQPSEELLVERVSRLMKQLGVELLEQQQRH